MGRTPLACVKPGTNGATTELTDAVRGVLLPVTSTEPPHPQRLTTRVPSRRASQQENTAPQSSTASRSSSPRAQAGTVAGGSSAGIGVGAHPGAAAHAAPAAPPPATSSTRVSAVFQSALSPGSPSSDNVASLYASTTVTPPSRPPDSGRRVGPATDGAAAETTPTAPALPQHVSETPTTASAAAADGRAAPTDTAAAAAPSSRRGSATQPDGTASASHHSRRSRVSGLVDLDVLHAVDAPTGHTPPADALLLHQAPLTSVRSHAAGAVENTPSAVNISGDAPWGAGAVDTPASVTSPVSSMFRYNGDGGNDDRGASVLSQIDLPEDDHVLATAPHNAAAVHSGATAADQATAPTAAGTAALEPASTAAAIAAPAGSDVGLDVTITAADLRRASTSAAAGAGDTVAGPHGRRSSAGSSTAGARSASVDDGGRGSAGTSVVSEPASALGGYIVVSSASRRSIPRNAVVPVDFTLADPTFLPQA